MRRRRHRHACELYLRAANRYNEGLRNVIGNCVTWCVLSLIPCATVPWSTLIISEKGAGRRLCDAYSEMLAFKVLLWVHIAQGRPASKISRRVSGPSGSLRCWLAGWLLHLVTKQNIPGEVGEWGLSIQRWLSESRKPWCRQLRSGKLATRQSSILCSRIHQGKSRRAVDGNVRTPSECQWPSWPDCPSWNTFLRLISETLLERTAHQRIQTLKESLWWMGR